MVKTKQNKNRKQSNIYKYIHLIESTYLPESADTNETLSALMWSNASFSLDGSPVLWLSPASLLSCNPVHGSAAKPTLVANCSRNPSSFTQSPKGAGNWGSSLSAASTNCWKVLQSELSLSVSIGTPLWKQPSCSMASPSFSQTPVVWKMWALTGCTCTARARVCRVRSSSSTRLWRLNEAHGPIGASSRDPSMSTTMESRPVKPPEVRKAFQLFGFSRTFMIDCPKARYKRLIQVHYWGW